MAGLPGDVLKTLNETLLDCGPFGSNEAVRDVFMQYDDLRPWRNSIPEASDRRGRASRFVANFLDARRSDGRHVLLMFLQAVHEQAIAEADCKNRLNDVAVQVAMALGEPLPPLARGNLWRATAVRKGVALPDKLGGYALPAPEDDPLALTVSLPAEITEADVKVGLESLKDPARPDWLPVSFLEKGLQAARAIGRVEHKDRRIGTAFLVAPDRVLTNAHVANEIAALTEGGVRFHVGLQGQTEWRNFKAKLAESPVGDLDFALLQLDAPLNVPPVTLSTQAAWVKQAANILQHPGGAELQVALRNNAILYVQPNRLYYVTDTAGGSSGSPIFDDDWRVIGLHRAGMEDASGFRIREVNEGVPMTEIAPKIQAYV